MTNKFHILTFDVKEIISILKYIIKDEEDNISLIDYPLLIGSRAAKWHISSFREPNNWDLLATVPQSISFIKKIKSTETLKNIKLIYYPGNGLKIVGECIDSTPFGIHGISIIFNIELVSDKVDFRKMKPNEKILYEEKENNEKRDDNCAYKETQNCNDEYDSYEYSSKENSDEDESSDEDNSSDNSDDVNMYIYDKSNEEDKIEFESFDDVKQKTSTLMILELCRNIKDKIMFPFLQNFLCIVAPLKILEVLKTSHIYWPTNFQKNIEDLHILRISLGYNNMLAAQPLCSPQRDEQIEFMLQTRIKETEIVQGTPAWIEKSLFEKVDYQTKLNCVKEEAMTIALESYLITGVSKNQETSYNLALARICTTLTKGWFRQFAVDNYPKLSNLDKDLLSVAHDMINKYSSKLKDQLAIMFDPETHAIFKTIHPYTKKILSLDKLKFNTYRKLWSRRFGIKITSPVNNESITAIITILRIDITSSTASVVILPSKDLKVISDNSDDDDDNDVFKDPLKLHPHYNKDKKKFLKLASRHVFAFHSKYDYNRKDVVFHSKYYEEEEEEDDDDDDGVCSFHVRAKSADWFANRLEIPNFNGDVLFKYVLYYLNPISINSELISHLNNLKVDGIIPTITYYLWYSAWKHALENQSY
ncbi:hypothetical protein RclHR1_11000005 [Rhizophagus clarus]|uniref:Uncharacterized protein n=1 Tax=Rhizophagus clarus TaxID=94130 RepID=A0A2Z6QFE3_9GLOM|nr:hypothetical protein RclHR1_11000005 [Rhizophagus clarus]GES76288.1 hypothetical protein GLOIN_2v1798535 [Rhizophagus clarus]